MLTTWTRRDGAQAAALLGLVAFMHLVAFGMLILLVGPHRYRLGGQIFSLGLGLTAYTYGLRHAFDADHIAAIDNTTRKLRAGGRRPKAVGFWFAMGHSATVFLLAGLVAAGARAVGTLVDGSSHTHETLALVGTISSGAFLYLIGLLNLAPLVGIYRIFRGLRDGEVDEEELESQLNQRGGIARLLGRLAGAISRPYQMFFIGMLFGIGFDTATEVALLVLAAGGAVAGVPWYAIVVLPLLFASGMTLLDSLDGLFMSVAYDQAFLGPVRKVYYNLTITGLSVAVALLIGTVEIVSVLHDEVGWRNWATDAISNISLNNAGFCLVGLFAGVWVIAIAYWNLANVGERGQSEIA